MKRNRSKCVSLAQKEISKFRTADSYRVFKHGLEDRFKLAGRGTDDLEHLRSRGFALARFGELAGQLLDICFLTGSEGNATPLDFWRIAMLQRFAWRFYRFAAYFVAPSHRRP
jgi:hypothetical protein